MGGELVAALDDGFQVAAGEGAAVGGGIGDDLLDGVGVDGVGEARFVGGNGGAWGLWWFGSSLTAISGGSLTVTGRVAAEGLPAASTAR